MIWIKDMIKGDRDERSRAGMAGYGTGMFRISKQHAGGALRTSRA